MNTKPVGNARATKAAMPPRQLVLLGLLVAMLFGCASLPGQQRQPAAQTYVLQYPQDLQSASATPGAALPSLILEVMDALDKFVQILGMPSAAPGFATPRMAYVTKPYALDYFSAHQWVDAPARMLEPLLLRALANSGLFAGVAPMAAPVNSDLRLDSDLLRLQQVFANQASQVELAVRVSLFDLAQQRLIFSHVFSVVEPAPEPTPYGGVVAANRAVASFLKQLLAFLPPYLPRQP